jgi:hypothetical protein
VNVTTRTGSMTHPREPAAAGPGGADTCTSCHASVKRAADLPGIRMSQGDLDGNGHVDGMGQEVEGLKRRLLAAIQADARTVGLGRRVTVKMAGTARP